MSKANVKNKWQTHFGDCNRKVYYDGFQDFFLSVNYLKDIIIDYFGDGSKWDVHISYLEEKKPLGTAGSLGLLPKELKCPFLVLNGDVLTKFNPHRHQFHNNHKAQATLSVRDYILDVPFGVIETRRRVTKI